MKQVLVITLLLLSVLGYAQTEQPSEEMLKLRDPFRKPVTLTEAKTPRSELEALPLDQIKLLAVLTGPNKLRALVSNPAGKTFIVYEGMSIGNKKGIIRKISQSTIKVREKVVNVVGVEESIDSEIVLPEGRSKTLSEKNLQSWGKVSTTR